MTFCFNRRVSNDVFFRDAVIFCNSGFETESIVFTEGIGCTGKEIGYILRNGNVKRVKASTVFNRVAIETIL